jgi:HD-GYP domain-containing protein (c-di-GMP phosphodiesterase class II)
MPYNYRTDFPIFSHRGEELVGAGCFLDEKTLQGLKARPFDRTLYPMGFYELVKKDLDCFLEIPAYASIFRDKSSREYVFSMLKRIQIPRGAVEVIECFKTRDFYTYKHMLVVFAISCHLVSLLSGEEHFTKTLIASATHDIGKYSIPLELLQKQTPLTAQERAHIEHHTLAGYAMIHYYTDSEGTDLSSRVARDHHERSDGSGYPAGITSIDRMVEIVIASDMYDALLSPRPYRAIPFDNRTALEELSSKALTGKISKAAVQALVASNRKKVTHWSECAISSDRRGSPPLSNNYGVTGEPG